MSRRRRDIEVDMLIVGSEGAGSRAAIEGGKLGLKTLVATKGVFTKCGATLTADMDCDVPSKDAKEVFGLDGDVRDTVENFAADMFEEGKYMNNEEVVLAHCSNAAKYFQELVEWGMKITGFTQSPGHRYPRGIVSSGRSMMNALKRGVSGYEIDFAEHTMVTDLLTWEDRVVGAVGVDVRSGEFLVIRAKVVVLATGGAMRVYPITTAPEELTGDGIVMAYEAGAELVDMEFPLFLPACLYWPESMSGVDFPYIFSSGGVGGWWLNRFGERFMKKWDPVRMEMGTTRDVASIAQHAEILAGRGGPHGGIWVSLKHQPAEIIDYSAATMEWWKGLRYGNFDLVEFGMDPREVAYEAGPAAHYWNGGVKVNGRGETTVPGLYAAGEVQGGTMGANRLSGNAITECLVFGALAGKTAAEEARKISMSEVNREQVDRFYERIYGPLNQKEGVDPYEMRRRIQETAFANVGPIRNEDGLKRCLEDLRKIQADLLPFLATKTNEKIYNREWVTALENRPLLRVLEIVTRASLLRRESRGAMYRQDYPETDNKDWLKNVIVRNRKGDMELTTRDVVTRMISLPRREKTEYSVPDWEFEKKV